MPSEAFWQKLGNVVDTTIDTKLNNFRAVVDQQIGAVNDTAIRAVELASGADAVAKQVKQQQEQTNYSPYNLMQRGKVWTAGPFLLGLTQEQQRDPLQRAQAANTAVTAALGSVIKSEPAVHWELFDVMVYEIRKGVNAGKSNVVFAVLKAEDAELIRRHRAALQSQKGLSFRTWLTDEELSNKKKVWEHPAFTAAVQQVRSKPRGTRGYTMGWELDRAFTVVAGARTYWSADSIQQASAQVAAGAGAGVAAAAAGGAGPSKAAAMEQ
jgi:hypothetical protein